MLAELQGLGDVSETLFLPFYARVLESRKPRSVLKDPLAESVANRFFPLFYDSERPLYRHLARAQLDGLLVRTLALRTRHFDRITQNYLSRFPDGQIVSLGCGLDTRFSRLDNGLAQWVELDLPPVMQLRAQLFEPSERITRLTVSVLDHSWFQQLPVCENPRLFLAEGLFMYLAETDTLALLTAMQKVFKGSELLCEMALRYWVKYWGWIIRFKLRNYFHLREDAAFYGGLGSAQELESRLTGLSVLQEWSYFDETEDLKYLAWLRHIDLIRRFMWSIHCQF
jgi:methyltransferase (TIGR00027 family)